jgi:U2-associated protein SR140
VFPLETHALFVSSFENPPVPPKESNGGEETAKKGAGRWKTVDAATASGTSTSEKAGTGFLPVSEQEANQSGDGYDEMLETGGTGGEIRSPRMQYSSGLDELFSDDDLDGEPDEDFIALLGLPSQGGDVEMGGTDEVAKDSATVPQIKSVGGFQMSAAKVAPKKRMRAVDMFAGSDSDGET